MDSSFDTQQLTSQSTTLAFLSNDMFLPDNKAVTIFACLVVLELNAILRAKVMPWRKVTMCFLANTNYFSHAIINTTYFLTCIRDEKKKKKVCHNQGPYLPTILQNVLSPALQIFQNLAALECNTTSDRLNRMV